MLIELQSQYLTILKLELELDFPFSRWPLVLAVEVWVVFVDDAVVVRADDNDVCRVVVLRTSEVVNVMSLQQRPVHRLLHYKSALA